ncbi:Com family DNA-binding transcriptional regulator [Lysinibacillus sp. KU-BSD001]
MKEMRCTGCGKLLAKTAKLYEATTVSPDIEMKCPKCKMMNKYKIK